MHSIMRGVTMRLLSICIISITCVIPVYAMINTQSMQDEPCDTIDRAIRNADLYSVNYLIDKTHSGTQHASKNAITTALHMLETESTQTDDATIQRRFAIAQKLLNDTDKQFTQDDIVEHHGNGRTLKEPLRSAWALASIKFTHLISHDDKRRMPLEMILHRMSPNIIQQFSTVNIDIYGTTVKYENKFTLPHAVCMLGKTALLEYILQRNVNPIQLDDGNQAPIQYAQDPKTIDILMHYATNKEKHEICNNRSLHTIINPIYRYIDQKQNGMATRLWAYGAPFPKEIIYNNAHDIYTLNSIGGILIKAQHAGYGRCYINWKQLKQRALSSTRNYTHKQEKLNDMQEASQKNIKKEINHFPSQFISRYNVLAIALAYNYHDSVIQYITTMNLDDNNTHETLHKMLSTALQYGFIKVAKTCLQKDSTLLHKIPEISYSPTIKIRAATLLKDHELGGLNMVFSRPEQILIAMLRSEVSIAQAIQQHGPPTAQEYEHMITWCTFLNQFDIIKDMIKNNYISPQTQIHALYTVDEQGGSPEQLEKLYECIPEQHRPKEHDTYPSAKYPYNQNSPFLRRIITQYNQKQNAWNTQQLTDIEIMSKADK